MTTMALTRVNGVFKGGGAKGIAYAGALRACRQRGLWFGSVAGASAGAITATLIAAGLDETEIEAQVPQALARLQGSMPKRLSRVVLGLSNSLFDSRGLYQWLDCLLSERVDTTTAVTFRELYAIQQIELYVVVMDLATGTPTVFSRLSTPNVDVAGAVVASCAIPGAFPAGRAVYDHPTHGATVHQLVDGGAWANYPMFVFRDRSFRRWVLAKAEHYGEAVDDAEDRRQTIGFVLGEPAAMGARDPVGFVTFDRPGVSRRFDVGPTFTSESTPMSLAGSVLGTDWCRAVVGVAAFLWLGLSLTLLPLVVRQLASWLDWFPDWLYPVVFVGLVSMVVLAAAGTFAIILGFLAISRMVADTVIPAGTAALGVATGVAPWAGQADDDIVVVVPCDGLSTTDFVVPEASRAVAVAVAHEEVARQLDDGRCAGKIWPRLGMPPAPPSVPGDVEPPRPGTNGHPFVVGVVLAAIVALIGGLGAWLAANVLASTDSFATVVALSMLIVLGVGFALHYVGKRAGARRARRARRGVLRDEESISVPGVTAVALAGVVCTIAGLVLAGGQMDDRDMLQVRLVASESVDSTTQFGFVSDDGGRGVVISDRPLRVGDDVLVAAADQPGTWTLAEPLPSSWFGVSVAATVFGLGLLTSAVKRWLWWSRCRRLSERLGAIAPTRSVVTA